MINVLSNNPIGSDQEKIPKKAMLMQDQSPDA